MKNRRMRKTRMETSGNSERRGKRRRRKAAALLTCAVLAGTAAAGGISAYFTDNDTATNTFTVGKVSLDLEEPNWVPPENITPEQEMKKDPQILNSGDKQRICFSGGFGPV